MSLARVPLSSVDVIPKGDKDAILNSIVETYRSSTANTKDQHRKKYKGKPRNKLHKISKYLKGQILPSSSSERPNLLQKNIPYVFPGEYKLIYWNLCGHLTQLGQHTAVFITYFLTEHPENLKSLKYSKTFSIVALG